MVIYHALIITTMKHRGLAGATLVKGKAWPSKNGQWEPGDVGNVDVAPVEDPRGLICWSYLRGRGASIDRSRFLTESEALKHRGVFPYQILHWRIWCYHLLRSFLGRASSIFGASAGLISVVQCREDSTSGHDTLHHPAPNPKISQVFVHPTTWTKCW